MGMLADDLEQFDAYLSAASVRLLQQAGHGGFANREQARKQWKEIRTDAAQIASRTHKALEKMTEAVAD